MANFDVLHNGRVKPFRNRQSRCRRCGKRRKGRPSTGYGLCHGYGRSPARLRRRNAKYHLREARKLARVDRDALLDVSIPDPARPW